MSDTVLPQCHAVRIGEHILGRGLLLVVHQHQLRTHPLFGVGGVGLRRFSGKGRGITGALRFVFHCKMGSIGIEHQPDRIILQSERFACRRSLPGSLPGGIVLGAAMLRRLIGGAVAGTAGQSRQQSHGQQPCAASFSFHRFIPSLVGPEDQFLVNAIEVIVDFLHQAGQQQQNK